MIRAKLVVRWVTTCEALVLNVFLFLFLFLFLSSVLLIFFFHSVPMHLSFTSYNLSLLLLGTYITLKESQDHCMAGDSARCVPLFQGPFTAAATARENTTQRSLAI